MHDEVEEHAQEHAPALPVQVQLGRLAAVGIEECGKWFVIVYVSKCNFDIFFLSSCVVCLIYFIFVRREGGEMLQGFHHRMISYEGLDRCAINSQSYMENMEKDTFNKGEKHTENTYMYL